MSIYYRWVCEERKEYFDPGELMGPKLPLGGYGIKAGSIPYSAWVVGALMLDRWRGCSIRLVGDVFDEHVGYDDVHQYVLRNLITKAPDEALEFLASQVTGAWVSVVRETRSKEKERLEKREQLIHVLREFAREDWKKELK